MQSNFGPWNLFDNVTLESEVEIYDGLKRTLITSKRTTAPPPLIEANALFGVFMIVENIIYLLTAIIR